MTKLKELRNAAGITQAKLGETSGLKTRSIQCYEQGFKLLSHARIDVILKICIALKCSIGDLISDEFGDLYKEYLNINKKEE